MNWLAWAVERDRQGTREGLVLVSAEPPAGSGRAAVVLNLVLDRSGSMRGAPLAAAIEAGQQVVEDSTAEDFLGLCLFDAAVEQTVPLIAMDARGKQRMHAALSEVKSGSGTALHAAVRQASAEANRILVPGRRPRLLLLTDGEPSTGPEKLSEFQAVGREVVDSGVRIHALGLAGHYIPEILAALTVPSGNGFAHVDGPDGLSVAMGSVFSWIHGEVATDASVRIAPRGFKALTCRHGYPTKHDGDALVASMGSLCAGSARRVLFQGALSDPDWNAQLTGGCIENADQRHQSVVLQKVWPDSPEGRLVIGINAELDLVASETAAWTCLARKEKAKAEEKLEAAEARLRELVMLGGAGLPVRRHLDRLAELRMAVEQGIGDFRLLARRSEAASTITRVSQIFQGPDDPRLRN